MQKKISTLLCLSLCMHTLNPGIFNIQSFIPTANADAAASCTYLSTDGGDISDLNSPMGESATFGVEVNNTDTTPGFKPTVEVILPPDTPFVSASLRDPVIPIAPTQNEIVTDNDLGDPATGDVINEITNETLDDLTVGYTYLLFELPVGSFVPGQPPITLDITVDLPGSIQHELTLVDSISTQCSFAYGDDDPLNNPITDPPVKSGFQTLTVTPSAINLSKSVESTNGDENEVTTGINFPFQYNIGLDVANNEQFTGTVVVDNIPIQTQVLEITSVNDDGNGCSVDIFYNSNVTPTPDETTTCAALPYTPSFPGPGGKILIDYNQIDGTSSDEDANAVLQVYIPELDANGSPVIDPNTGVVSPFDNTVSLDGTHTGFGLVTDSITTPVQANAESITIQKSVQIAGGSDIAPLGEFNPGDTVQYNLSFQVSDFFDMDDIVIIDDLADGLTYIPFSATLQINEAGSTTNPSLTEASVSEANLITGPPYDFSGNIDCLGCTLAITTDTTDDNDAITSPSDGQTKLMFDISQAMFNNGQDTVLSGGDGSTPTTGTISYTATVSDTYVDSDTINNDTSIDALDSINNTVSISSEVLGTTNYVTDSSSASFQIAAPTFSKDIIAIDTGTGPNTTLPNPIQVAPGNNVLYALTVEVPAGDLEDLVMDDFLPIPFFDADEFSGPGCGFQASTLTTPYDLDGSSGPATFPSPCHIGYGDNTVIPGGFPLNTGSTPEYVPSFTINSGNNSFTVDYDDNTTFDYGASSLVQIELVFNVTAQDKPFGSGLSLANISQFTSSDSIQSEAIQSLELASVVTSTPELKVKKGVLISTEDGVVPNGVLTPSQSAPAEITANLPGSSPSITFAGASSSASLTTNPTDSYLSEVDAGDVITFISSIENLGTNDAYDIAFSDSYPAELRAPAAGINLQVYLGDGTTLINPADYTVTGGGALDNSFSIDFDNSFVLEAFNSDTQVGGASQGENIVFITYDLEVQQSAEMFQELTNTASITSFAASLGGNNFVTGQEALFQDEALTELNTLSLDKDLISTDQAHTVDDLGENFLDYAIGEIGTYTIGVTLSESTSPNFVITDNLPAGMAFVEDNGVRLADELTDPETCTALTSNFQGTIPAFTVTPSGVGLGASGQDIQISFNSDIIVDNDDDPSNNSFCLVYDAVALDHVSNVNDVNKNNSVSLTFGNYSQTSDDLTRIGITTDPDLGERDDRARGHIVEPDLDINKFVYIDATSTAPTNIDAGDVLNYSIQIEHSATSTADALDLSITDDITGLPITINTNFGTDGLDNDSDGLIDAADADEVAGSFWNGGSNTFTWDATTTGGNTLGIDQLTDPATLDFRFQFTVNQAVVPGQLISNSASVDYDSLPGDPAPGYPERDYTSNGSADFNIDSVSMTKTVTSSNLASTTSSQDNASLADISIGEQVEFLIEVNLPESQISNLDITDTIPDFMRIDAVNVLSDGAGTPGVRTENLQDNNNADAINDTAVVNYATYTHTATTSSNTTPIQVQVLATMLNNPGNINLEDLTNTATVNYTSNPDTLSATQDIEVVRPDLNITKTVDFGTGEAGDSLVYTINITHTASSNAPAFDLSVTDVIPSELTLNDSFSSDGYDNTGSGVDDEPTDGAAALFWDGSQFTFNSITTGNTKFDELPLGDSITLRFAASVNATAIAGSTITNTANLNYDSYPGVSSDQSTSSDNDNAQFVVETIDTLAKTVNATNITQTTQAQFTNSIEDLNIGEEVRYRITIDIPQADIPNVIVTDVAPLGIEPLSGSLISDDGVTHSFTTATVSDNVGADGINDTTTFNFGNILNTPDADTEQIVVEVVAVVIDNPGSTPINNPFINNANVTVGGSQTASDTASVEIVQPNISLTKTVSALTGDAGDTHTYTVTMENIGSGPAFDLEATDLIPSGATVISTFSSDGLDNTGSGSNDESDAPVSFYDGTDAFTFNSTTTGNTKFDVLLPGEQIQLQYAVTLDVTVSADDTLTNDFDLSYDTYPGNDPRGNERTSNQTDSADITIPFNGALSKDLRDLDTDKTIGDTIPYEITLTVNEGTTDSLLVTDTLPEGLSIIPSTISISDNTTNQITFTGTPTSPTINPSSNSITDGQSQTITFDFGTVTNSNINNAQDEEIYIQYDVVVLNTSDNNNTDTKLNSVTANFDGTILPPVGSVSAPAITIEEPNIITTKTTSYTSGDTVTYRINLYHNQNNEPSAFDTIVIDNIDSNLSYNGNITSINGPTPTVDITSYPQVEFTISEIDETYTSAAPLVFEYTADIPLSSASGTTINNTANTTWTGQNGAFSPVVAANIISGERTGDTSDPGLANNDYISTDNTNFTITRPDLSTSNKAVVDLNGGTVQGNDILEYTVTIINTGNNPATGVTLLDDMPANVTNLNVISTPVGSTDNSNPYAGVNTTGQINISDISLDAAGGANDQVTVVYQVSVASDIATGASLNNNFTLSSAIEGGPGATGQTTTSTLEPILEVTKEASERVTRVNTPFTYKITVTNSGDTESLNTTLSDTLPEGVSYIANTIELSDGVSTIALTDNNDLDGADFSITQANTVTVVIPDIQIGETFTLSFQAQVTSSQSEYKNTVIVTDDSGNNEEASVTTKSSSSGSSSSSSGFSRIFTDNKTSKRSCSVQTTKPKAQLPSCLELVPNREVVFSDINPENPATPFINTLKNTRIISEGDFIVSGTHNHSSGKQQEVYQKGTWEFQPDRALTRLEAVKVALVSNCIPIEDEVPIPEDGYRFQDISLNPDPNNDLELITSKVMYTAYKHGVVKGYEDGLARPYQKASAVETLALSLRASNAIPTNFEKSEIQRDVWYQQYIDFAQANGIYAQQIVEPNQKINRSDFAQITVRVMAYNPNPAIHGYIERVNIFDQTYNDSQSIQGPSPSADKFENEDELNCTVPIANSCHEYDADREVQFSDISEDAWYYNNVTFLKNTLITEQGDYIVSGVGNHSTGKQQEVYQKGIWEFRPNNLTTKLELVKMALVANCIPVEDEIPIPEDGFRFDDISLNPQNDVELIISRVFYTAYKHGVWTQEMGSIANPLDYVNRYETVGILGQASLNLESISLQSSSYSDLSQNWYTQAVLNSQAIGIIDQFGESNFNGERQLKRSEVISLITRFMLLNKKTEVSQYTKQNL